MKKISAGLFFLFFVLSGAVMAQSSNISGGGQIVVNSDYGPANPRAGGYTGGSTGGSFSAGNTGGLDLTGFSSGRTFSSGDYASSGGGASTTSNVYAYGPTSKVSLFGEAHQGNWASAGGIHNSASGGNFTAGEYGVNFSSPWGINGYGSAAAYGDTSAGIYEGPGYRGAWVSTNGNSSGFSSLPVTDSRVSGYGGINAFSGISGSHDFATAGISGNAGYNGALVGGFKLSGNTDVSTGNGYASARASIFGSVFTVTPPTIPAPPQHP